MSVFLPSWAQQRSMHRGFLGCTSCTPSHFLGSKREVNESIWLTCSQETTRCSSPRKVPMKWHKAPMNMIGEAFCYSNFFTLSHQRPCCCCVTHTSYALDTFLHAPLTRSPSTYWHNRHHVSCGENQPTLPSYLGNTSEAFDAIVSYVKHAIATVTVSFRVNPEDSPGKFFTWVYYATVNCYTCLASASKG